MRTTEISITLSELQEAVRSYAEKHGAKPDTVVVTGFGDKPLIIIPTDPGATIDSKSFRQVAA